MDTIINKYTFFRVVSRFFDLIYKSFHSWRVTIFYSIIITLLSGALYIALNFVYLCGNSAMICYISVNIGLIVLLSVLIMCFLYDFYQASFKNSVFKAVDIIKFNKTKIKSLMFLIGYILCYALSAGICWYIFKKPANPDWKIEFIYFCVFFLFCMLPMAAMRFSAAVAFFFHEQKIPSLKYLFTRTERRSYIGIVGFLMVLLILSVLNLYTYALSERLFVKLALPMTAVALKMFCNILVILFTFIVILCFFEAQRQLMVETEPFPIVENKTDNDGEKEHSETKGISKNKGKKTANKSKKKIRK